MRRIWSAFAEYKFARHARLASGVVTAVPVHGAAFHAGGNSKAYSAGYSHGADAGREHGLECSFSTQAAGSASEAMMKLVSVEQMARILGVKTPMENGRITPAFATSCGEYNRGFAAGWEHAETAALEQVAAASVSTGPSLHAGARVQTRLDRLLVHTRAAY